MNVNQTWDLDVIFPGGSESSAFQTFLDDLKDKSDELGKDVNKVFSASSVEEIANLILKAQAIGSEFGQAWSFVGCLTAQNVKDDKAKLLGGRIAQLSAAFSSVITTMDAGLVELSEDQWQTLLHHEALRDIQFGLNERRQKAKEKLDTGRENLISDLAVDGYHAWGELYETLVGRMTLTFVEDGEEKHLSMGQAHNKMSSPDRKVRQEIFGKWEEVWGQEAELIAKALNHLVGFRLSVYRHRNWESFLKEPLEYNRMTERTLAVMWDVIEKNKVPFVEYLQRKAQLLGLDKLAWYDVPAPLGESTTKMSYETAQDFVESQFRAFSPDMADFAKMAFEKRWVEAEDRASKAPGAFCTGFPVSEQTRVFMTFSGSASNVSTLAHELGHAYHGYVMRDMPDMARDYAMNVAETASTFAEMIVADASVKNAKDHKERLALIESKVERSVAFFMDIHARFIFDTRFHERRKQGYVSAAELCDLMVTAQKEAFHDTLSEYHPHFWASKGHFYGTYVPFYNFPYTFGYLFSTGIYARAIEEGPSFADKYVALLRDTASMTTEQLAQKHLGVDLTQPEFWQSAVDLAVADVKEFLRLSERFVK